MYCGGGGGAATESQYVRYFGSRMSAISTMLKREAYYVRALQEKGRLPLRRRHGSGKDRNGRNKQSYTTYYIEGNAPSRRVPGIFSSALSTDQHREQHS
jgi:hypothetical protein